MRVDDNEHVRVHEMRGFIAEDLKGAFKETEAISRGTKCSQYLFSLSLSPPENERVPPEVFEQTIDRIEERLGLQGQPRVIVFHEKEGRRHAHCAWSRIDAETMTARPLPFFKTKLMGVSRDLYLEHGWKPRGIANSAERNPTNFTLAEWQQAKRQGVDPRWIKQTFQECWNTSDNGKAFAGALEERGFFLAKGDRRGHVVVDHMGEVHALTRALNLKTKDVRDRLGHGDKLPTVEATKKRIGERMTPAIRRHVEEARTKFQQRSATLGHHKMEMTHLHRESRTKLEQPLSLEWQTETRERAARLPKGVRGLWHRITRRYQEMRAAHEKEAQRTQERHGAERQALIEKQLGQRAVLQTQFKDLRTRQAAQLRELREDVGRYLKFSQGRENAPALQQGAGMTLKLGR
ncbi:relaxase [Roseococcus sp. SYP-B2431]|uniref:relaxase/mobilization nuclease domain-containing protein n=1 Tax=Roseococcus sp. SYP-B2431 TaxID=2496640 RepID=UPI00103A0730|nr:relaxase [Roseococcus sp. SYP-B2431]TCI00186.1 relaxase [Roseococcus sp. SYP-B2431]